MAASVFVDTSGFYAFMVKRDGAHRAACKHMRALAQRGDELWTTDYVLDETATLLKARALSHLLSDFFEAIFASKVCHVEWMDADRFLEVRTFCLKHRDHPWSFTDCFSFCVMKRRKIARALTKDGDFHTAGFVPLLVQARA